MLICYENRSFCLFIYYFRLHIYRFYKRLERVAYCFILILFHFTCTNSGKLTVISDSIKRSIYSDYLDSDGNLNYFKIDNIYDDERVKNYYQSPFNLCNAYKSTDHFEPINYTNLICLPDARTLLRYSGKMNEKERRIYLIYELVAIDESNTFTLEGKTKARSQFILSLKDHKLKKEAEETIEAFDLIGLEAIKSVGYSKTKIKPLVKKAKKERNEHTMFTKCVRDAILTRFPELHEYYQNELFEGFNTIFESFGIEAKVNISTVEKYYGVRVLKAKVKRALFYLIALILSLNMINFLQ